MNGRRKPTLIKTRKQNPVAPATRGHTPLISLRQREIHLFPSAPAGPEPTPGIPLPLPEAQDPPGHPPSGPLTGLRRGERRRERAAEHGQGTEQRGQPHGRRRLPPSVPPSVCPSVRPLPAGQGRGCRQRTRWRSPALCVHIQRWVMNPASSSLLGVLQHFQQS